MVTGSARQLEAEVGIRYARTGFVHPKVAGENGSRRARSADRFLHLHDGQSFSVGQRQCHAFTLQVSVFLIQRHSRQRCAQLAPREPLCACRAFANLQQPAPDPAPRPFWMHEEGPNLRGLCSRMEQGIVAPRAMIASVRSLPPRPPAACRQHAGLDDWLYDEIGFVCNQLRIESQPCSKRLIDLRRRILLYGQSSH